MPLITDYGLNKKIRVIKMRKKQYEDRYRTGEYALSGTQLKKLLNSFGDIFEKAIIHLTVSIGLRRLDVVNIKRNDYDENTGILIYYEHKKRRTRTVKIPSDDARNTLKMYVNIRDNEYLNNKWLFPSPLKSKNYKDKHVSDRQIYDLYNEKLELIGIDKRPFHSLRATCIKMCDEAGWEAYETAELVGDKVSTILEHYMTPSKSQMEELSDTKQIM